MQFGHWRSYRDKSFDKLQPFIRNSFYLAFTVHSVWQPVSSVFQELTVLISISFGSFICLLSCQIQASGCDGSVSPSSTDPQPFILVSTALCL